MLPQVKARFVREALADMTRLLVQWTSGHDRYAFANRRNSAPRFAASRDIICFMNAPPTTSETAPLIPVIGEYIAVKPGFCGGKPHVLGHRIKVQHVAVWHERMGMSADEIVTTYPTLTLAQVYASLSYYHAHRSEIDADIKADEEFIADMKTRAGPSLLQQGLAEQHAADNPIPF